MKTDPTTIQVIERLLDQWKTEVSQSTLKPNSQETYILHADHFVRWAKDDFQIKGYKIK